MAYADFGFYENTYHGTAISLADFPRLAEQASDYLDYITQGRAERNTDSVKLKKACCALAEQYKLIDKYTTAVLSDSGELSGQTVGSYSVSYRSGAESAAEAKAALYKIASIKLAGTGMVSRARSLRCMHPTP